MIVAEPVDVAAGRASRSARRAAGCAACGRSRARSRSSAADGEIEVADLVVEVDAAEAEGREMRRDRARAPARRRMMPSGADRRVGQQHVVEHGQIADQRHLLEGGLDAERVRVARAGRAAPRSPKTLNVAGVRRDQAGEQLDHRRLAGAVLAEQRVDAAGRDRERSRRRRRRSRRRPCADPRSDGRGRTLTALSQRSETCPLFRVDEPSAARASGRAQQRGARASRGRLTFSGWPTRAACRPISGVSGE